MRRKRLTGRGIGHENLRIKRRIPTLREDLTANEVRSAVEILPPRLALNAT